MRKPEYLSPSSLMLYEKDSTEWYCRYLSDIRPPRAPQTAPMSVGSAFDAHAKSYLHRALFGAGHAEAAKYTLDALLEAQVEPHLRQDAREAGRYCFEQYKASGALADLMLDLSSAVDDPRFEFEVKGVIGGSGPDRGERESVSVTGRGGGWGVPLLGKPDIRFINSEGAHCILDFKVNGYYGRGTTSPMAGYVELLTRGSGQWMRQGPHKNCVVVAYKGMKVDGCSYLEHYNEEWATQLAVYSWLMGENVGAETVVGVDQLVCSADSGSDAAKGSIRLPSIRIAKHRSRVGQNFQFGVLSRFQKLWALVTDEPFYFFRELPFEDSARRCAELDRRSEMMGAEEGTGSLEEWALSIARTRRS